MTRKKKEERGKGKIYNIDRIRHKYLFECYALLSPQINCRVFHFDCIERKRQKRNMLHIREKKIANIIRKKIKKRNKGINDAIFHMFQWNGRKGEEDKGSKKSKRFID